MMRWLSRDLSSNETKGHSMLKTRAFNEGNSQAVYIPEDLAYARADVELK